MKKGNKFSDGELMELYLKGLTNREIADALGVSQPAVYYRLQKLGLHNNCHELSADPEQVRILHSMGVTTIGIAHLLKVNVPVIEKHLKKMGLEDNYVRLKELVHPFKSESVK